MTTIAWDGKVLAADTLVTCNGFRTNYAPKIWREGRLLCGGAGSRTIALQFRDWVRGGMAGPCPLQKDIGNVFVIRPDGLGVMWCDDGPFTVGPEPWALGSGEHLALGALEMGADALRAVEVAIKHHTGSGGAITVLTLQ